LKAETRKHYEVRHQKHVTLIVHYSSDSIANGRLTTQSKLKE